VVTFAVQNADKHDDVAGAGNGIVDVFPVEGTNRRGQQKKADRFAEGGVLNSPWGVALAPAGFGELGGLLLIGNFGDGKINAFDPDSGDFRGTVSHPSPSKSPILLDGLWTIKFRTGSSTAPDANTLYFTAGVNGEKDGLFGTLTPSP
jgi:uncharacterized protein (TIGR03118 family)